MIKCYLFGGLGNQIFQFLAGLRLSYLSKKKIIFDYSLIDAFKSNHEVKIYELFDLKKKIKFDNTNIVIKKFLFTKILIFLFNLSRKLNLCKQMISESNFMKPLENKVKYFQYGYFQDLKFIPNKLDVTKKILVFKKKFYKLKNYKIISKKTNSVCVHIRGGDYLTKKSKKKYVILNENYYRKSILLIKKRIKNPFFYIFSNDIKYSSMLVKKIFKKQKYKFIHESTDIKDFFLMSSCKNFILSNSTFSWWASYLSYKKGKIIICPKRWFVKNIDNVNNKLNFKSWLKI